MVTISKDNDVVTLINVFTVAPEDQQRLVDVLVDATQAVMRKQQGFIRRISTEASTVCGSPTTRSGKAERRLRLCFGTEKRPSTWGRQPG